MVNEYDKHYMRRFFANLFNDYNISEKEFIDTFTYGGGAEKSHLKYYRLRFGLRPLPESKKRCVCGHIIRDNCYMTNCHMFVVLGNCCIKRYCGDSGRRTCCICKCPHRNSKNNYCKDCRLTYLCKCGKTKKQNYLHCYNCYDNYNNIKNNETLYIELNELRKLEL